MVIQTKLMVFGGGPLPTAALSKFHDWAAEKAGKAKILIIAWASEEPEITIAAIADKFASFDDVSFGASLEPPSTKSERAEFLEELAQATAVFFSGGDQNRHALATNQPEIRAALHARYRAGLPFAGTSAGTAIMSTVMFSGDTDPGALDSASLSLARGLGLCDGVIFDQHFLKRQRQNRLFAAILRHPEYIGIGVDEGTALAVENGQSAMVIGPEKVMRVEKTAKARSLAVEVFHSGETFELFQRPGVVLSYAADEAS